MSNKDDLDQLADAFVPSWEDEADHHEVTATKPLDVEVARRLSEQLGDSLGKLPSAPVAAAPVVPPAPVTKLGFGSTMLMSNAPPVPTRAAPQEQTFPTGEAQTAKNLATLSDAPNTSPGGRTVGLATSVDVVPAGSMAERMPPMRTGATMVSATGAPLVAKKHAANVVSTPPEAEPIATVTGPVAVAPIPLVPAPKVPAPAVESFVSTVASNPVTPRREGAVSHFSSPSDEDIVLPKQPSNLKWVLLAVALLGGGAAAFAATRTPAPVTPPRVAVATTAPSDPPTSPIPPPPAASKESDLPKMPASAPPSSTPTTAILLEPHAAATLPANVAAKVEPKVEPKKPEPPKVEPQKPIAAVKRPPPPPLSVPAQKPAGKGKGVIVREVPF